MTNLATAVSKLQTTLNKKRKKNESYLFGSKKLMKFETESKVIRRAQMAIRLAGKQNSK